jgi:CBS-domain-containing membrane protein
MWSRDCGVLPVLEDSGRVIGVVTDRDLFIALATSNRPAAELAVGEIVHREPSICAPDDDIRTALKTMARQRIQRLPVVDKSGELKGILSMNDVVLRAKSGADGVFKDDVIRTLKAIYEHRQPAESEPAVASGADSEARVARTKQEVRYRGSEDGPFSAGSERRR